MEIKIFPILLGMMLVTSLPRIMPLVVLSRLTIPPLVLQWLRFIPVAVLASLLAPELFLTEGSLNISLDNHILLAAIPAFGMALYTKNLFYTVFTGMACIVAISRFIG